VHIGERGVFLCFSEQNFRRKRERPYQSYRGEGKKRRCPLLKKKKVQSSHSGLSIKRKRKGDVFIMMEFRLEKRRGRSTIPATEDCNRKNEKRRFLSEEKKTSKSLGTLRKRNRSAWQGKALRSSGGKGMGRHLKNGVLHYRPNGGRPMLCRERAGRRSGQEESD